MGTAMDSVSAAYAAITKGRLDTLAGLLADDLDWRGPAGVDGAVPSCHGRATALERMRRGVMARPGEVSVREFIERGDRVLAHVVRRELDGTEWMRFVVAEVRGREIASLRAYATEREARHELGGERGHRPDPGPLRVQVIDVAKSYGAKRVLHAVSMEVRAGEAVAITGENGAGKSTLLGLCAGLVRADAGSVRVDGAVGYCPQEPGLFDLLTADEHLTLFGPARGLGRQEAVAQGRLLLGELGFPVGDRSQARRLSGGARQKLNLALALLGGVDVLLLDEPYQGFDHGSYVSFWEHVERWRAQGVAVVIVTHLLSDLALVDRVVELTSAGSER